MVAACVPAPIALACVRPRPRVPIVERQAVASWSVEGGGPTRVIALAASAEREGDRRPGAERVADFFPTSTAPAQGIRRERT